MKVKWISRQYSRFDLALTKLSRPLTAVNTLSNLAVAVVIGFWIFGTLALIGFLGIGILGYILHRSGFFMETMNELFDQQSKELWERQTRYWVALNNKCQRMDDDEIDDYLEKARSELRL